MQANIVLVTVRGEPQDRDADLVHVQRFEVETDTGNRYVVDCQGPAVGSPSDWEITRAGDGSAVGRVYLTGAGFPGATEYRYYRPGARFSSGKQFDLWNAVQSLLD